VAAGTVILVLTSRSSPSVRPRTGGTATPTASTPAPPSGRWEYIGSRTTDSVPLTARELYPDNFTSAGTTYVKVKQDKRGNCGSALIGSGLKAAVRKSGCTQAIRATYVARGAHMMATIGVFNLESADAAGTMAAKAGHFNFVAQLQANAGPASKIGQGTGFEEAIVKGHYLVLVWAEYTNLGAPRNRADRAKLASFMSLLIARTANVGLSYRMAFGKPST